MDITDFVEQKARLAELEALEVELARDLEAQLAVSADALIMRRDFDLSLISGLGARIEQVRRAVRILERRIESFLRREYR